MTGIARILRQGPKLGFMLTPQQVADFIYIEDQGRRMALERAQAYASRPEEAARHLEDAARHERELDELTLVFNELYKNVA